MVNSRLGLFTAAPFPEHPFSRSYGVILPSSLTMLLPSALGFSPHPPVSVYGTGLSKTIAAFLDSVKSVASSLAATPSRLRIELADLPASSPSTLGHALPTACSTYPSVSPLRSNDFRWYRNINLLSIGYVFRPGLRPRLTQSRSALLWKP